MAKYTELFSEYLAKGYALPSSFELIEGFEDLFKKHYCDKEIGFETELLFTMKLDEYATLYMQKYADRIAKIASAWLKFDAPAKVYYEEYNTTFNAGAQGGSIKELPFDATVADPSSVSHTDAYENTEARTVEKRDSGETSDEAIRMLEFLNSKVYNIIETLLKEFKPLFMAVY